MTLICQCCGFRATFANADEAFEAGWDEPTHLPSWPVVCNLCPGSHLLLIQWGKAQAIPQWHLDQHTAWIRDGRPAEFDGATAFAHVGESTGGGRSN